MSVNGPENNPFIKPTDGNVAKEPTNLPEKDALLLGNGIAQTELEPDVDITTIDTTLDAVRDEKIPVIFNDMQEFIDFIDKDKDGVFSESEIKEAQKFFEDNDTVTVVINDEKYNLLTTKNTKTIGSEGKDIIIGSNDASNASVKGNGGDDIIITAGISKVIGGDGEDTINGVTDTQFCEDIKEQYGLSAYNYAVEHINENITREALTEYIAATFVGINDIEKYNAPDEFASMDDFKNFIDKDGDGEISVEEEIAAKELFQKSGVESVTIGDKEYNMVYDNQDKKWWESNKTWGGLGSRTKIKGTKGNDIIWGTEGDDKIKGKKGDDIIFGLGGDDKIKGGRGHDIEGKDL